jgi:hypothetical protein
VPHRVAPTCSVVTPSRARARTQATRVASRRRFGRRSSRPAPIMSVPCCRQQRGETGRFRNNLAPQSTAGLTNHLRPL